MNEEEGERKLTDPGGAKKVAYGTSMPALGRERAPRRIKFMSFLFSMSGTRSAGILEAWHVTFMPLSFRANWEVLVDFTTVGWDNGENIPFLLEQS